MNFLFYVIGFVMIVISLAIAGEARFVTHEMEAISLFVGGWLLVALGRAIGELQIIRENLQVIRDR